jgi:BASS family bile acid:Na+ symporter
MALRQPMDSPLSEVQIQFEQGGLMILNLSLAFIMFGVALNLKRENFGEVLRNPRGAITGVVSQFLLLPAFTFLLVWLMRPLPGIALGMILVAACPGGNVSNFYSMIAKGNIALSVSLTAIATLLATFMTPLNYGFWGGLLPFTAELQESINLNFFQMFKTVLLILAVPLALGIWFAGKFPGITKRISGPIKNLSFLILMGIIVIAFYNNLNLFLEYYQYIILVVLAHNAMAFGIGYFFSRSLKNTPADVRSITIETGIQNSGLGLIIIFNFFDGHGGMAIVTAWWGIWHIISGFAMARFFSYRLSNAKLNS